MAESDKVFAGSIPEIYDSYLVPLIFEVFAEDLAERVAALKPAQFWKQRREAASSRALWRLSSHPMPATW